MTPFRLAMPSVKQDGAAPKEPVCHVRLMLAAIFVGALALRLATIPGAGIYHPDELFQYLEQAHRIAFGQGIVPWEFRSGMRSWLLPALLSGPMAVGGIISPGTSLYLVLPRGCAVLVSMSLVWCAWRLGRRISATGGLVAAAIAAGWAEFVYFAPHILSETTSLALLLSAAILLTEQRRTPRLLALSGFLLAFAVLLRLQHLPAAIALVLLTNGRRPRDLAPLVAGATVALAIGAAVDALAGQMPFGWAIESVRQNIVLDRAAHYGSADRWAYARAIGRSFGWFTPVVLVLAAVGARREPIPFLLALLTLAVHMLIAHKEYRFILMTSAVLLLLAAVGTAQLIERATAYRPDLRRSLPVTALAAWAILSASIAAEGRPALYAMADQAGPAAFAQLHHDDRLCGLATYRIPFSLGGGYTFLHRRVPLFLYGPNDGARLLRDSKAYNRLIAPASATPLNGFHRTTCFAGGWDLPPICIYARAGDCAPSDTPAEINRALTDTDQ
jgi:hypothetical protein